ncbi:hypothetical protein SASPL_143731 [Salvia splendens]|uniref:Uncharacterized protein n=1 Tax=Salvia splendens TaxID=180675 RepID=A0A8X8ZAL8_SALSN|nr:hypothetical protein SASPL_143731 [Salvia splendens]
MMLTIHLIRRKRLKESVLRINDPEADKQVEEQTAEEPKKGPASKKVTKEKVNKGKEKVGERVKKEETNDEKIKHETLKLKTSPRKIIELFQSLNEEQLNEVIDMGIGELQHFGIVEVPAKMAYDLVKGFNNVDCTIQLENQRLAIYPEDVYVTVGLPIGGTLINRTAEKDQWEVAIEGFATASEDDVRVLQNLLLSMTDVKNMIQNFEAIKIAGATACNMIGVILEVEVDEEETVTSLQAALAKDNFNSPELVEAVKSMFKVTAQLTKLAEEGPPFDIHPSFEQKNGDKQERNNIVGTSFNGGSVTSNRTSVEKLYTVVMSNGRDDDADKLDEFASNIDKEVSKIPHFAWGDIDMVFFAFCISKRYYTVCFCFKRRSVVIIDACKDGEDNDLRFTYGCIPEALV